MGEVQCLKLHQHSGKTGFVLIRELKSGEHFGELALINKEKRSLSVRVSSETCRLLKLDRETFTRILGSIQDKLNKDYNKKFDEIDLNTTPMLTTDGSAKKSKNS